MQLRELIRPDATLRYGVAGPEDGPVVVLLHGAALDHHAWDPQVESLRHHYRLVAPDLRGHGDSAVPDGFVFAAAVADIVALLEILPDRPVAFVGLSLGGNIAQEVVRQRPGLVDALVVADSTCNTTPRHPLQTAAAVTALTPLAFVPDEDFPPPPWPTSSTAPCRPPAHPRRRPAGSAPWSRGCAGGCMPPPDESGGE